MRRMGRILEYDFGILRRQFFHPVFNAVNQVRAGTKSCPTLDLSYSVISLLSLLVNYYNLLTIRLSCESCQLYVISCSAEFP